MPQFEDNGVIWNEVIQFAASIALWKYFDVRSLALARVVDAYCVEPEVMAMRMRNTDNSLFK